MKHRLFLVLFNLLVVFVLGLALSACGGVRHATRSGTTPVPNDPTFVEVRTTGLDSPYTIVSWSAWEVALTDTLPDMAPSDIVTEMREEAARRGATMLLLDRVENAWRKVWLGLGVVRTAETTSSTTPPTCSHAGFAEALIDAMDRAETCGKRLKYERPQLAGDVHIVFEVDPFGQVLQAAATPDSSRDGQLQACALEAVHATPFGTPPTWSCQGHLIFGLAKTSP